MSIFLNAHRRDDVTRKEQSKTKQPLKIFKKQNVSVKTEQNATRVIFLPPPPLETPKVKKANIQRSATTIRQQFDNDTKQAKTSKRKHPQKVRKVLKPTVGYNSKYSQANTLKKFKETKPIQMKNYEGQQKKRTTREIKPAIKVNTLEKRAGPAQKIRIWERSTSRSKLAERFSSKAGIVFSFYKVFWDEDGGIEFLEPAFRKIKW